MKPLTEREIQDLLTPRDAPEPPAGLAAAIKRQIPAEITLAPETSGPTKPDAPSTIAMPRSRVWLMAASVAVAVGGGFLAYRLMDQLPAAGGPVQVADAGPRDGEGPVAEGSAADIDQPSLDDIVVSIPDALPRGEGSAAEGPADKISKFPRITSTAPVPPETLERRREELHRRVDAVAKRLQEGERQSYADQEPEAASERLVAPPPPPPPASPRPLPPARLEEALGRDAGKRAATGASAAPGNARVDEENALIHGMREQAAALESELKKLEVPKPVAVAPPSTGGTAEPNDAPYGDVFFSGPGTNPFIDTEDDAQSTFGLDVDTGSYTVGRRYLRDGHLPPPDSVRPEEYLNYFDYGDSAPEGEDEFAIHAEGAPSIFGEGERYHLLRFNLSGREIASADRKPAQLIFVVDVSGSMGQGNRLGLVKQALTLLLDQLRADDRVALVVYGSRGRVVLAPTGDLGAIRRAVDGLRTEGATNAEEGLTLAYDLAARHRRGGAINRVILCSDGVANVGRTSADSILDRIRREADRGIELTTVGFGMGNYNDVLMERLADDGNGRYAYVDTLDEARRIFVENLTGTLQTLAAEARVQVEFDPQVVSRYRLVGYENRDIADERFRDDTVDAGEIGVGHRVTALYEIKTHRKLKARDRVATLHLRYGSIARGEMVELSRAVTGADFARRWDDASPALKLTSLVAEYAEILKRSYWAREGDLDDVFRRAQKVSGELAGDREVADFVSLVGQAARLKEREPGD